MKPGMIKLETPKPGRSGKDKVSNIVVRWAYPYFKSGYGRFTHRVRSGHTTVHDGVNSHVALQAWCGFTGFITSSGKNATVSAAIQKQATLCAACEARAIRSGLDPARRI